MALQLLPGVARANNTKVTLEAREKGLQAKADAAAKLGAAAPKMEPRCK